LAALCLKNVTTRQAKALVDEKRDTAIREATTKLLVAAKNERLASILSDTLVELCVVEVTVQKGTRPDQGWPTLHFLVDQLQKRSEDGEDIGAIVFAANSVILRVLNGVRRLLVPLHRSMKILLTQHARQVVDTIPLVYLQTLMETICEKWSFAITIFVETLQDVEEPDDPQERQEEQELILRLSQVCAMTLRLLRRLFTLPFTVSIHRNSQAKVTGSRVTFANEVSEKEWNEQHVLICTFSPKLHAVLEAIPAQLEGLFSLRSGQRCLKNNAEIQPAVDVQIIVMAKAIEELTKAFPRGIARYLAPIASFYLSKVLLAPAVNDLPPGRCFEQKFIVYAIRIVTAVFEARTEMTRQCIRTMFEDKLEAMKELLYVLLTKFMAISNEELQLWESDPQELMQDQLADDYQYSVKPSAEFLWLAMIRNYPDVLSQAALGMLNELLVGGSAGETELQQAIRKSTCYNAVTLCYNEFSSLFDFNQFFTQKLLPDLQEASPAYKLVRRQVCVMLCEDWSRDLNEGTYKVVYEMLVSFLKLDDYVIAVWAAIALRNVTRSNSFSQSTFAPFMEATIDAMIVLAHKLQQDTLTTAVVDSIGLMCRTMTGAVTAQMRNSISGGLLKLWEHNPTCPLLRNAVLGAMATLIDAAGTGSAGESSTLENDCTQLVLLSTDITGTDKNFVYTTEGLRVWLALLERAEDRSTSWLLHRYPSSLAERFDQLLSVPVTTHIDPTLLLSIVQHHTVALGRDFAERFRPKVDALLVQMLTSDTDHAAAWKSAACHALHTKQMVGQAISPEIVSALLGILSNFDPARTLDHPELCHALAALLHFAIVDVTVLTGPLQNGFSQFLPVWFQLAATMAKDAIFARINALAMLVVLAQVPGALKDKADAVVRACHEAAASVGTRMELSDDFYANLEPKGFLLESYTALWAGDVVNKNICAAVMEQAEKNPNAFANVQPVTRDAVRSIGEQPQVIPTFGGGRHYG